MSNSPQDSRAGQQLSWLETPKPKEGKLIFSLTVPGRLPSWNDILGMEQWARYAFKKELAAVFSSALQQSERDSLTRTISAKNTTLIFSATLLAEHLEILRQRRILRSRNKKLAKANPKKSGSKSLKSNVSAVDGKSPLPF